MQRVLLIISVMSCLVMFQNCGKVSFDNSVGSAVEKSSAGSDESLDQKVPISDLINSETGEVMDQSDLFEVYPCKNRNERGILICHYPPGNADAHHTICVGESALAAHLDHGQSASKSKNGYSMQCAKKRPGVDDVDGKDHEENADRDGAISEDYVGPCIDESN